MANNHLIYDRTKPLGKLAAEMAHHLAQARALATTLKGVADEMGANGGGANGAVLEVGNADGLATFGVAAGQGNAFYTALTTLKDNLNGIGANGVAQDKLADLYLGG